jgi:uncharacterized protein (TIGR02147 family)
MKPFYLKQLEHSFESRSKVNPRYSLRAYARDLGVSVSRLSGVLNGKFGLSSDAAREIARALGLEPRAALLFVDSVESRHARSKKARELALTRLQKKSDSFQSLSLDQFQIISDWQHFAILELTHTGAFLESESVRVARRLGISVIEAKRSIERLLNFDLLSVDAGGVLKSTGSFFANKDGVPSDAIRKHQKQLLDKAARAVDLQTTEERSIRSLTIAIDRADLPELQKLLDDFQTRMKKRANQAQTKNEVYAFTMQFFRLTEKENKA